jgi:hypothetical protein
MSMTITNAFLKLLRLAWSKRFPSTAIESVRHVYDIHDETPFAVH